MLPMSEGMTAQACLVKMIDCWGETIVRQFPTRLLAEAFVAVLPDGQTQGLTIAGVNMALIREAVIVTVDPGSN